MLAALCAQCSDCACDATSCDPPLPRHVGPVTWNSEPSKPSLPSVAFIGGGGDFAMATGKETKTRGKDIFRLYLTDLNVLCGDQKTLLFLIQVSHSPVDSVCVHTSSDYNSLLM